MNVDVEAAGQDASLRRTFEFSRCEVSLRRRELRRDGKPVPIGSRAFDLLVTLIHRRGGVVGKDELIESVWPGRIVEENTLESQLSAVRRALGEDRDLIRTVTGRGYQFTGDLREVDEAEEAEAPAHNHLPQSVTALIGREAELQEILSLAGTRRLITLVGSGGVGKTRLAIEAGRQLASRFPDGIALAELALLRSPEFIGPAVAEALGCTQGVGSASLERIASFLSGRRMLLVLDNCEHLVAAAAQLAETLLRTGAGLRVIATSREPLRASGEAVYHVPCLTVPSEDIDDPDQILRHTALQLFQARAGPIAEPLHQNDAAELAAKICRRLDGIPLAIELAAARVQTFGLPEVASRIDDCFSILTNGARTALPRQRTLRATLDWSFQLLSASEQALLERLSLFTGPFTLEAAIFVAPGLGLSAAEVVECVTELVAKSLVSMAAGAALPYRLLETTRLYAGDRLRQSPSYKECCARHAQYYLDVFRRAEIDWKSMPPDTWSARYGHHLDGVRAAVDWSFSVEGTARCGIELTTSAIPLWTQKGLLEELLSRVNLAITRLEQGDQSDAVAQMKLYSARAAARLYRGVGPETLAAFQQSLTQAEVCADKEHQLRGLWGLWAVGYLNGRYSESLALARRFSTVAPGTREELDRLIGDRMAAMSMMCLGRLGDARDLLERAVDGYHAPADRHNLIRFIYEERVITLSALAHVVWLQGFQDRAARVAGEAMSVARAVNHPPTLCYSLTEALCPISLLNGGTAALAEAADQAVHATKRHGISTWKARGQIWSGLHNLRAGDASAYHTILAPALQEIGDAIFVTHYTGFLSAMCEQLAAHRLVEDACSYLDRGIGRARAAGDLGSVAELMRVRGELWSREAASHSRSENELRQALALAQLQESLSWTLRCATSLARALHRRGAVSEAREVLAPIHAQFRQGLTTVDLLEARRTLHLCSQPAPPDE